ncbi:MAG TPA: UDP-N-acetylglucosamine--N-acetylmuramyl-(pentapeptide) pyrophosphoryl-undecaprenol N-acetylglucosamine transferase [Candidatus Paceibacterota bacterium]|jgi:UDP-N-acetylglucosamine--N-acetylmuramyl-(pentapeptide) pyrophosphoryl-undecaprenol N-acetylglucosamine transferase|nr:UDP-N-acetylglucosamine--N-acetylmuramyl-(pentapeptide) pyrophosphoryl-undecaprenol N-acetylglucosamine transferase [Parcubacteria group bacterium]HOM33088.1 UDP-N-acetylglucosamine--N-acetylmuramyl-(pentapeptide) pyrophosphoryl-undecaprenol N-acetylglucosamine transferase [Candidatus Paceibacterota bacterium]HPC37503.1 UDP-N-acetylglucosamine--N-acetylmuramyl-(pentapeptide) pyrophosphoryl-undecaprenol N-acetylglucosamine transferase [Candidatus Paceibacterota bacterium]HRU35967.1 UDP-N-acety
MSKNEEIVLRELKLKIVLAGGGTGGHIYPLIAVYRNLKKITDQRLVNLDATFIGADTFDEKVFTDENIKVIKIFSGKWRNYFSLLNFLDIFKIIFGIFQSLWYLWKVMPDMIFSKGGYGALPVVIAGFLLGIPIIEHESDTIPGKSNKIAASLAKKIIVSFSSTKNYFPPEKAVVIGNPIRESILNNKINQKEGKKYFNFLLDKPVVLFLGGSQGSQRINDLVLDSIEGLLKNDIQIIHQTGPKNFKQVFLEAKVILEFLPPPYPSFYQCKEFLNEKDYLNALVAADLIVARAGSGTIFEIAASQKPAILIPLPEAAHNHQKMNAIEYARYGGAIVLEEENATPNILIKTILDILQNEDKKNVMINSAKLFIKRNAAEEIAKEILLTLDLVDLAVDYNNNQINKNE